MQDDRIRPSSLNPRYWQLKGRPVMLLGANKTDSPFLLPDAEAYFAALARLGGNYTRYVVKQRLDQGLVQRFPHKRLPDGAYDLNQWDEVYWERFEQGLRWTRDRDIVVQLELWDRFDIGSEKMYALSAWRPANNVTYTQQSSGMPDAWVGGDAAVHTHPFFQAVINPGSNPPLLELQRKYVQKILSVTFKFDHVLYVVTNESTLPLAWSDFWATYVRERAKEAGKEVEVSEMPWTLAARFPFEWQLRELGEPDRWINNVIERPELYSFCAFQFQPIISQAQTHFDRLMEIRGRVEASRVRPMNAVKVFASKRLFGAAPEPNPQTRYWRILMAGWAAVSLHREHPGSEYLGFSEAGQRNLSAARKFCDAIVPWLCVPANELLASRAPDSAYLLAQPGRAYGVYFPTSGTAQIRMGNDSGNAFALRWISIETGQYVGEVQAFEAKATARLETPAAGSSAGWAATLIRREA